MIPSPGGKKPETLTPETALTVDRSRCVRHRCTRNECRKCMDVCPTDAVTWNDRGLRVDAETCTRCLRCLSVCPTAALRSPDLSLPRILSELAAHPAPVLGCHGQPASDAHARISCLGYLAHAELMPLLALGFSEGLQINLSSCGDCANGHILEGIRDAHARLRDLKPDHGIKLVHDRSELDFQPPALSRRDLFKVFRKQSARAAIAMVTSPSDDTKPRSYGKKQVPATRTMLLEAMEGLSGTIRRKFADQLFGKIVFTPECVSSGGCVGVCPTGAIQPADEDEQPPIFDGALCVSCNSCHSFCRNRGVVLAKME